MRVKQGSENWSSKASTQDERVEVKRGSNATDTVRKVELKGKTSG